MSGCLFCQNENDISCEIRQITVESKLARKGDSYYSFSWSKEFDIQGNLICHKIGKDKESGKFLVIRNYEYDDLNRLTLFKEIHPARKGDTIFIQKIHTYHSNGKTVSTISYPDSILRVEKTISTLDSHGNVILDSIFIDNELYSIIEHYYEYDSKGRIIYDKQWNNLRSGDYSISTHSYSLNRHIIKIFDDHLTFNNENIFDTIITVVDSIYHENGRLSEYSNYTYHAITGEYEGMEYYVKYDEYGNQTEYLHCLFRKKSGKMRHPVFVEYQNLYNNCGYLSLVHVSHKEPSLRRQKKAVWKYQYEYW